MQGKKTNMCKRALVNFASLRGQKRDHFDHGARTAELVPRPGGASTITAGRHVACKYLHAHSGFLPFRSLYTIAKFPEAMG
jgi:hypothetical protein